MVFGDRLMDIEQNPVLINKINKVIKSAVGDGRDHLSEAESIDNSIFALDLTRVEGG